MARLSILRYPDPRLYTVARPVTEVDTRIRRLVDDMLETMYEAEGVGLAATQVDVHERVIVIDTSEARAAPGSRCERSTAAARRASSKPRACFRWRCSTRWITCWARSSSTT